MDTDDLSGKVFVTSGLGGMSGAQAKVQEYLNGFKKYFYGMCIHLKSITLNVDDAFKKYLA